MKIGKSFFSTAFVVFCFTLFFYFVSGGGQIFAGNVIWSNGVETGYDCAGCQKKQGVPEQEHKRGGDCGSGCVCKNIFYGRDAELIWKIIEAEERAKEELMLGRSKVADDILTNALMNCKKAGIEPPLSIIQLVKITHRMMVYEALTYYFDYFDKHPLISENMLDIAERYYERYLAEDDGVKPVDFLEQRKKLGLLLLGFFENKILSYLDAGDAVMADLSFRHYVTECKKMMKLDASFVISEEKISDLAEKINAAFEENEKKQGEDTAEKSLLFLTPAQKRVVYEELLRRETSGEALSPYEKIILGKLKKIFSE
jgi:hypothetical protein